MKKLCLWAIPILLSSTLSAQDDLLIRHTDVFGQPLPLQIKDDPSALNFGVNTYGRQLRFSRTGSPTLYDIGMDSGGDLFITDRYSNTLINFSTNGNVGIGTSNPNKKLEVKGSILVSNTGAGFPSLGSIIVDEATKFTALTTQVGSGSWMQLVADTDALGISKGGSLDQTRIATFKTSGNVGIGTEFPVRKLEIGDETNNFSAFARLDGSWSTQYEKHARIEFNDKNFGIGAGALTGSSATDDDLYLWSFNGQDRDISFLSTSNGETDPSTWNHNMIIKGTNGNVGIGLTNPDEKLVVDGKIRSEEVIVEIINGPDYVFEEDYDLRTLEETKAYIVANKHLPEIPSAKEMEANGVELGDMNMRLLKKIEELTLHLIDQSDKLEVANQKIDLLQDRLDKLETRSMN